MEIKTYRQPYGFIDSVKFFEKFLEECWCEEVAERYPLSFDQLIEKAGVAFWDSPVIYIDGKLYPYDTGTDYVHILEDVEDKNYLEWEVIQRLQHDEYDDSRKEKLENMAD